MAIKVTQAIVNDAVAKGVKLTDLMSKVYEEEIADKVKSNPKLEELDPLEIAMFDAGLSNSSLVKEFITSDNEYLFPAIVDTRIAEYVIADPYLNYIVTTTQTVPGTSINGLKFDAEENKDAVKLKDIAEGADLPLISISSGKQAITLYKRGAAVQITYEAMLYSRIDLFMRTIKAATQRAALSQIASAISVLVSGDGNNNAASVTEASGTAFAVDDILDFAINFSAGNDYAFGLDTIICNQTVAKQLKKLLVDTTKENGYYNGVGFDFPQFDLKNIAVITNDAVPKSGGKDILIGLNRENALTRYVAAGSQINELGRNIKNQTQLSTISEIVGFGKFMNKASAVMKLK